MKTPDLYQVVKLNRKETKQKLAASTKDVPDMADHKDFFTVNMKNCDRHTYSTLKKCTSYEQKKQHLRQKQK